MTTENINLELDAALVARARAGGVLNRVVTDALRWRLDHAAEDAVRARRWAEDNALMVEALAGGAAEAALR